MKSLYITLLFLSLILPAAGCTSDGVSKAPPRADSGSEDTRDAAAQVDSTSLQKTAITAHMEEKIKPGKNLLYCSTFQIAWNELKNDIIKEDIHLQNEPPMVQFLNKSLSTKADISDDCYIAMAGFGKDNILEKINKALKEKFGDEAPVVQEELQPDWFLAYAYLYKNLMFKEEFENLERPIVFRSEGINTNLKAFGIREYIPGKNTKHQEVAKQVTVLDYRNDWDFIIRLKSTSPNDEIVIAKIKPRETLLETINVVQDRSKNGKKESLSIGDSLQIPRFDFNIKHSYSELIRKFLKNKGFTTYQISKAIQSIRFGLCEKGAVLRSEARIALANGGNKDLVFNSPFLIYLKEKGTKYPYFAMWVDNPELMVKE